MDGSILEEKSSFKMLGLTFSSKLDWGSYIISIAILLVLCFFLLRLLCISINLPYSNAWNTVVMSGLVLLVVIPRCYKDVYVNSFFPRTARLWNSLPIKCFPLTSDLNRFKSRINRHLLTVGSF